MLPLPLSHVLPSSELSREKMGKTAKERKGKQGGRTGDSSWQTASLNASFSLSSRFVHPFPSPIAACFRMCVKAGRGKKGEIASPGVLGHRTKAAAIEKKGRKFQEGQPSAKLTSYFFLCSVSFAVSSSSDSLEI